MSSKNKEKNQLSSLTNQLEDAISPVQYYLVPSLSAAAVIVSYLKMDDKNNRKFQR